MTLAPLRQAHRRIRSGDSAARSGGRGQSMVELALVLPVILLLVVIALDFGRVYLGYINLQNMARIAANHAANNPEAWSLATPDAVAQARYRNQVLEDTAATNCALPETAGGDAIVPDPVFSDQDANGTAVGLGDMVTVRITCAFGIVTPIIGGILGDEVEVSAESNFPVKAGITAVLDEGVSGGGGGGGGSVTAPPVSGIVANSSVFATPSAPGSLTVVGPDVVVDFRDASGGGFATAWDWDFGDGVDSISQDVAHGFSCPAPDPSTGYCSFLVTFTASNPYGTSEAAYMAVYVLGESETNFDADRQVIDAGSTVTFTDESTLAGDTYAWTFGDGASTSGPDAWASHAYATPGTYSVTLEVTYPAPIPAGTVTKTNYITVNVGMCPVPVLSNVRLNDASAIWRGAPYRFTGSVERGAGANSGNFTIKSQSLTGGSGAYAPCDSDIYVSNLSTVSGP